jgi:dipeptidyl aminopeptidase/acylaminoacyl peptidase
MTTVRRIAAAAFLSVAVAAGAQQPAANKANWTLSNMFSDTATLRRVSYTTSLTPNWINGGDSLWYNWRDHNACNYYVAYPRAKAKTMMFNHALLASQLSVLHKKPFDPTRLPFNSVEFAKDAKSMNFGVEGQRYEWTFATQELKSLGRDTTGNQNAGGRGGRGGGRASGTPSTPPIQYCQGGGASRATAEAGGGGRGGGRQGGPGQGGNGQNVRSYSPDSSMFVFGRAYNVYLVNAARNDTVQLSKDGERYRSFANVGQGGGQQQQDSTNDDTQADSIAALNRPVRVNVDWAPDSKAFLIRRTDQRKVKPLYLVNSLSMPRPTLMEYKYAMPGEEDVNQQELWLWRSGTTALKEITEAKKWKDQQYIGGMRWDTPTKLRLVRRDRLQRNMEYIEYDVTSGSVTPLIMEKVENANLEQPNITYTAKDNGDIIWWSERSGWGHYYLYDHNGRLKNAITSGQWRAAPPVVALDSVKRVLYVSGLGREDGENPYYRHLYKVNLDGSGLTLMDAGNAMHSPSANDLNAKKTFYVDNANRTDLIPKAVVRDEFGKVAMELETTDMSSLKEMGWKASEPFMVKAADGITDVWGNMYKPFDFDSTRKYPIIAHVYPGPQTEGVTYTFSLNSVPQRLANLGFIVVQLGNRGGSPDRSNAYQSFSYFNMRDYGLADKKAGLEQLAAKYKWIDIERVGIFGHSGGGFMTAAAMMLPPYNEFFKVGVSSSGNHDNNIYNQNWSEQYHGLAEIITAATTVADNNSTRGGPNGGGRGSNGVVQQGNAGGRGNAGRGSSAAAANAPRVVHVNDTVRYEIRVPTTVELAPNLKGNLLLAHGDQDNNVTPSGTIRLMDALIKANKRFDFIMLPGQAHGYGPMQGYFNERLMEYFAEHLLGDYYRATADMNSKKP